jgi:hypothetical protein
MKSNDDLAEVVLRLLRYFGAHPLACDSCEGIAQWWLGIDTSERVVLVQQALDCLEREGIVVRLTAADGRVRYRRASGTEATKEALQRYSERVNRHRLH